MSDYTDLTLRLNAFLHDSGSLIYAAGYLDEGLAQALDAISNAMGSDPVLTINGFRSATSTTLPSNHFSLLIQGSAAYCIIGRSIKRSETTNLNQQVPESILSVARSNLSEFNQHLEIIRKSIIDKSITPPYPTDTDDHWPLDNWDDHSVF